MKINSPQTAAALQALQAQERKAGQPGSPAVRGREMQPAASTQVQLSSTASALAQAEQADGSFDMEKVQRMAQAIREGRFEVNPEKIADKLLANARELIASRGQTN